jgi:hypothetical protein
MAAIKPSAHYRRRSTFVPRPPILNLKDPDGVALALATPTFNSAMTPIDRDVLERGGLASAR